MKESHTVTAVSTYAHLPNELLEFIFNSNSYLNSDSLSSVLKIKQLQSPIDIRLFEFSLIWYLTCKTKFIYFRMQKSECAGETTHARTRLELRKLLQIYWKNCILGRCNRQFVNT